MADVRICRLRFRGRRSDVGRSRASFLAGLDRLPWPESSEVIHLRTLRIQGRAHELTHLLAEALRHHRRNAPSGWSPEASGAEAVRFRDPLDRRACLLRDVLEGTARDRWFWRSHPALQRAEPRSRLLASLLMEAPLELPDLVARAVGDQPALAEHLWQDLAEPEATLVLQQVEEATSWQPGLRAARTTLTDQAARRGISTLPWTAVLAALVDLWPQAASRLTQAGAGMLLVRRALERLGWEELASEPEAPTPLHETRSPNQASPQNAAPAQEKASFAGTEPNPTALPPNPPSPPPTPIPEDRPRAFPTASAVAPSSPEIQETPSPSALAELPWEGPSAPCTALGGWFYLLNLLGAQRQTGTWGDLWALGRALGLEADAPLREFFADELGVPPEHLEELLPPEDLEQLLALGRRRYGAVFDTPATYAQPARLIATRSHLDLHFPMSAVSLDIRRVGLDVNPGWLPWLGRAVAFHYGTSEAPA